MTPAARRTHDSWGWRAQCACKRQRRGAKRRNSFPAGNLISTEGWLCVHCGQGHLHNGTCDGCGFVAVAYIRRPLRRGWRRHPR